MSDDKAVLSGRHGPDQTQDTIPTGQVCDSEHFDRWLERALPQLLAQLAAASDEKLLDTGPSP